MQYTDVIRMLDVIQKHALETGHRITSDDRYTWGHIGFTCTQCDPFESQAREVTTPHWFCLVSAVRRVPVRYPVRMKFISVESRVALAQELTLGTCSLAPEYIVRLSRFEREDVI